MNRLLILALAICGLAGCAASSLTTAQKETLYEDYIESENLKALNRITAFKFRGWRSLDSEHLIISTSPHQPYLITLQSPCVELKFTQGIAINHSGTNILYSGFDSISVPKFPDQKCFIKTIYSLTEEQADEMAQLHKQSTPS
jgi:hypothetical protein